MVILLLLLKVVIFLYSSSIISGITPEAEGEINFALCHNIREISHMHINLIDGRGLP